MKNQSILVKSLCALLLSVLAVGCGNNKRTLGFEAPPPVPAPVPPGQPVEGDGAPGGGIEEGPRGRDDRPAPPSEDIHRDLPPRERPVDPPRSRFERDEDEFEEDETPTPRVRPAPRDFLQRSSHDSAPKSGLREGTPPFAWMHYNVEPMLKSIRHRDVTSARSEKPVRITLALGYFDGYHDRALSYEGRNYGRHVPVDPWLSEIVDVVLRASCGRGSLEICGFTRVSKNDHESLYERRVRGGVQQIRVITAALSVDHDRNTRSWAREQQANSRRAAAEFAQSFGNSDLVVYVGHSRKGGGPDFEPPRLNANGRVDYGYYQKNRSGARLVTSALRGRVQAQALALFSCDSTDHFLSEIKSAAPRMQLATVSAVVQAEDLLAGGLASMDLYLRQGRLNGLTSYVSTKAILAKSVRVISPR